MIFTLDRGLRPDEFLRTLQSQGIKAGSMGDSTIRFVDKPAVPYYTEEMLGGKKDFTAV